ncbi:hypothetical protein LLG96_10210 [bacterium]|nr:hypothetical protein [bacterium]
MTVSPRREFLKKMLASSALPLYQLSLSCGKPPASSAETYLHALMKIFSVIIRTESGAIRDAANLSADTLIARNRCFLYTGFPAQPGYLNEDMPGLPRIFINLRSLPMAETIRSGDMLLATDTGEFTDIARKNGARIVGITSPPFTDEYKQSLYGSFAVIKHMGDSADMLIRSHLPFRDGLVKRPEYPFSILPATIPVRLLLVMALAGETYRRSGGIGLTGNTLPRDAAGFIGTVLGRMNELANQAATIHQAGTMAAEHIAGGGRLWIYDSRDALKTMLPDASGIPLFAHPISRQEIQGGFLKSGDVVLFGSLRSNATGDLNLIRALRSVTNAVITICPRDETGGYRLFKESAHGLDNLSSESTGVMSFDDGRPPFLHTGGIMNCILMWMVIGAITDSLAERGEPPCYLMGSHLAGSEQYNAEALAIADKRGY